MSTPIALSSISKRDAIIDAVYRATLGLDHNDAVMWHSAWAKSDEISFEAYGMVMKGLAEIDAKILGSAGAMDTTHSLTNFRVEAKDGADTAHVTCVALAQHFRPGEGLAPETKPILVGGYYEVDLVEDKSDGLWKIKTWKLEPKWTDGDQGVFGV